MKKILVAAVALGSACAASPSFAASSDDVMARLAALEQENAAIRKENAALRENKKLRSENASLKSASVAALPVAASAGRRDPLAAYAADMPMAYKAHPMDTAGQLRIWGEGGAAWSGGDVITQPYNLVNFVGGGSAGAFDLAPKTGWQAAAGFDYRFAASPWHVSGQFRYSESGRFSDTAAVGGPIDPALIPLLGPQLVSGSSTDTLTVGYKETHWLADGAVGYDVLGSGSSAMQLKMGLRIAELAGKTDSLDRNNVGFNFNGPFDILRNGSIFVTSANTTTSTAITTRSSFFGAGPRIGAEGSAPLGGGWALDYAGDAAVLFGRQRLVSTTINSTVIDPAILAAINGGGGATVSTATDQRYATVFNADLQVGLSYWLTDQVKLSASYRLDAYFNVLNQTFSTTNNQTLDRYIHGPHLGVSATF